jgi:hypothetical protein
MPDFTFNIIIYMERSEDKQVLAIPSHSLYFTTYMSLVELRTREYVAEGWRIKRVSLQDFVFLPARRYDHPD